jgi:hypothetical protein
MKDHITVGAMAGLIAGAIGMTYSHTMFLLGFTPMSALHLAASLVTTDVINLTTLEVVNAVFTHLLVAANFAVLLTYLLVTTGKDFWVIKGIGFGATFCLISHSYLIPLMRTDEQVRTLIFNGPSWTVTLTNHILIGLISAIIIVKYHYLFNDPENNESTL